MRDAGIRLRELIAGVDQIEHWVAILPLYAELQLSLSPRVERFLALGVPNERLGRIAHHLERALEDQDTLLLGRPDGVTQDEFARLRDRDTDRRLDVLGPRRVGDRRDDPAR